METKYLAMAVILIVIRRLGGSALGVVEPAKIAVAKYVGMVTTSSIQVKQAIQEVLAMMGIELIMMDAVQVVLLNSDGIANQEALETHL